MKFTRIFSLMMMVMFTLAAWAGPVVEKVRVGQNGEKTRVVLEVSSKLKPTVFTLPNPDRVVLDFGNVTFKPDVTDTALPKEKANLIQKMRQGIFKPGKVRMVLDVKQPVTPTVFGMPASGKYPYRVVLDLRPRGEVRKVLTAPKVEIPLAPVVRPKVPRREDDPIVIVVDPGHGGVDPGAIGLKKTKEKDVVLQVAKELAKELEKIPNVKAILTRNKDVYIKLNERVKFAQRRDADMFISLHADSHRVRRVRGASVYVLSEKSSDREAARLAKEANEGDLFAGVDLSHESKEVQSILIDLTQRETMNRSSILAQMLLKEMGGITKLRKDKVLFAGFRVLKAPEIPSVLVETAYLSNPTEENNLRSSAYRRKLAKSLAKGVKRYVDKHIRFTE